MDAACWLENNWDVLLVLILQPGWIRKRLPGRENQCYIISSRRVSTAEFLPSDALSIKKYQKSVLEEGKKSNKMDKQMPAIQEGQKGKRWEKNEKARRFGNRMKWREKDWKRKEIDATEGEGIQIL